MVKNILQNYCTIAKIILMFTFSSFRIHRDENYSTTKLEMEIKSSTIVENLIPKI